MTTLEKLSIKVADEVWIATALLHKEHPETDDFSVAEILARLRKEEASDDLRPGVYVHIMQHCVAGRAPSPGRYRMLVETSKNRRRLFRPGDPFHHAREGSKTKPDRRELPVKYHELLDWYDEIYSRREGKLEKDPILALRGAGKHLWDDEHADDYVRRIREGWE